MKYTFPENFWWGAATSGPQSEGRFNKKHDNVFDHWFDINPELFHNGIGPNIASNFYNSYKEDLAMLKEIGLNSFRTSIQWTRLIKDFETGEPDEDGLRFYNGVIDECLANGIDIIMNLHHFDLPVELYDKYGGWESKHVVELFAKFAKTAFSLFGDRVKKWSTFNEPIVIIEGQFLYKWHYPCIVDGKRGLQAAYNIALASARAIEEYRKLGQDGEIGIIVNLTPAYPRSESKEDLRAAEIANAFFNELFLDPATKGEFPKNLVEVLEKDGVMWDSRMNPHRGWEIYPKAIYDIAKNVQENYGNIKWFISENGMGVEGEEKFKNAEGIIEDDYRIEFIIEHLEWIHKAIEEGSNCVGYHLWTPIDCWSWLNSYKNRYGFISLDLETQKKTIKKSGRWIKEVSKNNGF